LETHARLAATIFGTQQTGNEKGIYRKVYELVGLVRSDLVSAGIFPSLSYLGFVPIGNRAVG